METGGFRFNDDEIRRLLRQGNAARAALDAIQRPYEQVRRSTAADIAKIVDAAKVPNAMAQMTAYDRLATDVHRTLALVSRAPNVELQRALAQIVDVHSANMRRLTLPKLPPVLAYDAANALSELQSALRLTPVVDAGSWEQIRTRLESMEVDPDVLDEIEESLRDDPAVDQAASIAADALRRQDPALTREQARTVVLAFVYLMVASLICWAVVAHPDAATIALASSGATAFTIRDVAGRLFDEVWPPGQDCSGGTAGLAGSLPP
jgi:hypothetical protein